MNLETWSAVDHYWNESLLGTDPVLEGALAACHEAGLPEINVTPSQGKALHLFAGMCGAKRILEIGTLGGYSTIWLARALPQDGRLVTLELDAKHARVAQANLTRAGEMEKVELCLGPAAKSLAKLIEAKTEPFDFIFIDADKAGIPSYFEHALRLSHPGTVIVVDNVIRKGAVIEPDNPDPDVQGVRRFNALLAAESRVSATVLQTVGSKGYDGFALVRVND